MVLYSYTNDSRLIFVYHHVFLSSMSFDIDAIAVLIKFSILFFLSFFLSFLLRRTRTLVWYFELTMRERERENFLFFPLSLYLHMS